MFPGTPNPRELGKYIGLAQVGLGMAAPIGVGVTLDLYFGWMPWGTIVGAVLGLVGGVAHLVAIASRQDRAGPPKPPRETP